VSDDPRHELGIFGEDLACAELGRRGYEILARRHRTRYGEIDIIARDAETTVFVEVKTRDARMAVDYAVRHGLLETPCRVDVVEVALVAGAPRIEVFRNAFDVRVT
jgi:putative endonuclease